MFDFISYARDTNVQITILPPPSGTLISLEVRDRSTGYFEHYDITDTEAASCGNIDRHTGLVLDRMVARIGARKAKEYAT